MLARPCNIWSNVRENAIRPWLSASLNALLCGAPEALDLGGQGAHLGSSLHGFDRRAATHSWRYRRRTWLSAASAAEAAAPRRLGCATRL